MILITGLDGSGKSTILNRLETDLENQISVLRVPTIEAEKFKGIWKIKFLFLGYRQLKLKSLRTILCFTDNVYLLTG